jgi:medium-chain acyl-[acyl-carrier-protein] hydrolase
MRSEDVSVHSWFLRPRPNPQSSLRLFCFPFAGGGASTFRAWPDGLPLAVEVVAVELPGRETRIRERPFRSLEPLVDELMARMPSQLDRPFAFFGHSMGALIAHELACALRRAGVGEPLCLIASAAGPPHAPSPHRPLHDLPDDELRSHLRRLNGTPEAVLDHDELMKVFFPLLRADLAVCETHVHRPSPPLDCPILAFGGKDDRLVSQERLERWRERSRAGFASWMLPGDHFFLTSAQRLLLWILAGELERIAGQMRRAG